MHRVIMDKITIPTWNNNIAIIPSSKEQLLIFLIPKSAVTLCTIESI